MVRDILPGGGNSQLSLNPQFAQLGDLAFFRAETPSNGLQLFVTDGSTAGTRLVTTLQSGALDAVGIGNGMMTTVGQEVFFSGRTTSNGSELWKTDGITTVMIRDIRPGASSSSPQALTAFNNKLYFQSAGTNAQGVQDQGLWESDSTEAGTRLVKDTHPSNTNTGAAETMAVLNDLLFFRADGEQGRVEPWVSDGTANGTRLLKDINPGNGSSEANGFTTIGNKVFFFADDGTHGFEPWVTDGTSNGTFMLRDIGPDSDNGISGNNFSFTSQHILNLGGLAVFLADDGVRGRELWMSDGTTAGTQIVRDIASGSQDTTAERTLNNAAVLNERIYFQANANTINSDRELWVSDGTSAGTRLFVDLNTTNTSAPEHVFAGLNLLFFSADGDSDLGRELWIANESGITREIDLNPNGFGSPEHFFDLDGQILFFADAGFQGRELWRLICDVE